MVSNIFHFHSTWGRYSNLTSIFFGWVVQPPSIALVTGGLFVSGDFWPRKKSVVAHGLGYFKTPLRSFLVGYKFYVGSHDSICFRVKFYNPVKAHVFWAYQKGYLPVAKWMGEHLKVDRKSLMDTKKWTNRHVFFAPWSTIPKKCWMYGMFTGNSYIGLFYYGKCRCSR